MFKLFNKFFFVLTLSMTVCHSLYAGTVEQKKINFPIKAEELLKGDVHYFFTILSPRQLAVQYPELFNLDSLSLNQENDVEMMISKTVYLVSKPVGFFDDKQLLDEKYVAFIMGEQKIKKLSPDTFKIVVPGEENVSYIMRSFIDADDVSTLPNSKIISGVSAAKNLDVISKGASTIMFTERTNFTKYAEGGVSVSSYIPMNERKTLIITYNLWAVKKPADHRSLKAGFLTEVEAVRNLQDKYKP